MNAFIIDDDETAKRLTRRWLEREPNAPMALEILAIAETRTGNFYQAIKIMIRVLSLTPEDEAARDSRDTFIEAYLKQSDELRKTVSAQGNS